MPEENSQVFRQAAQIFMILGQGQHQ